MRLIPVLALLAATPLAAQEMREVSGTALVRERIALPEEMVLAIEARGPLGVGLSENWIDGNAVTDFTLDVPAGMAVDVNLALIGAVDGGGRLAFTAGPFAVPAGSEPVALGHIALNRYDPVSFQLFLDCGGQRVGVGVAPWQDDGSIVAEIDGTRLVLGPVEAGSGARYVSADDPGTWLWNQGEAVTLSVAGVETDCSPAPGVTWEAAGEGWSLVLTGDQTGFDRQVAYALTRGEEVRTGQLQPPLWQSGAAVLAAADEGGLALRVTPAVCGNGSEHSVEVSLQDTVLTGCGGDRSGGLTGAEWIVEEIAGAPIGAAEVSVTFGDNGSASGNSGCNRWSGQYTQDGTALSFGAAGATMMACPPEQMQIESSFHAALQRVVEWRIDDTGALILTDAGGAVLIRAHRQ